MSNFHANTADKRKTSVSSNSDVSNRINNEPSNSLLNTTNLEFIDADTDGVSKLDDAFRISKIGCGGEIAVTEIGNNYYFLFKFHFGVTE